HAEEEAARGGAAGAPGGEGSPPQRTAAPGRARLKREIEGELAEAEALEDQEIVLGLERRERQGCGGIEGPEGSEGGRQTARIEWVTERRLEAQLEAKYEARIRELQAKQAARDRGKAFAAYGPAGGFGGGSTGFFPHTGKLKAQPTVPERIKAGVPVPPDE